MCGAVTYHASVCAAATKVGVTVRGFFILVDMFRQHPFLAFPAVDGVIGDLTEGGKFGSQLLLLRRGFLRDVGLRIQSVQS
jgi:hypothetical protein